MGHILLVYGRNMVVVLYFSALFVSIGYMLQYIFVFLEAYWENRIVFSLLGMYDTDLNAKLTTICLVAVLANLQGCTFQAVLP